MGDGTQQIDTTFTAPIRRDMGPGGWTVIVMPGSGEYFGTRKPVKVGGTEQFRCTPLFTAEALVGQALGTTNSPLQKGVVVHWKAFALPVTRYSLCQGRVGQPLVRSRAT